MGFIRKMEDILLQQIEKIYKEIAKEDKKLNEDFVSISLERMENLCAYIIVG